MVLMSAHFASIISTSGGNYFNEEVHHLFPRNFARAAGVASAGNLSIADQLGIGNAQGTFQAGDHNTAITGRFGAFIGFISVRHGSRRSAHTDLNASHVWLPSDGCGSFKILFAGLKIEAWHCSFHVPQHWFFPHGIHGP
ncbi:MAG: hypothetical protein ACI8TF_002972 [Paracoccaceae bacterium]|jgi:hypothetical protein